MKFSKSIIIKAPIDMIVECYTNDEIRLQWDSMIVRKESRSGIHLKPGAESMIYFKTPNGTQELHESILENNLPHSIKGLYVHMYMENTLQTKFESLNSNETKLTLDVDYFKTKKFFVKVFMTLFPKQFKTQVEKTMNEFKSYVEGLT